TDFGKTWKKILRGIPEKEFAHVIREDPNRKGLLYAGTERGLYVSFDDGDNWQSLQLNLPVVPIHDLAIQARDRNLIAATHGRSFWVLDDLDLLYQMNEELANEEVHLFKPGDAYRMRGGSFSRPGLAVGKNPPNGVVVYYNFRHKPKGEVKLEFLDESAKVIKTFTSKEEQGEGEEGREEGSFRRGGGVQKIPADSGLNRFVWNMRYPDATNVPGAVMWAGGTRGPLVVPGKYQVRLTAGKQSLSESFEIKKDPRLSTTPDEFRQQLDLLLKIRDKLTELDEAVNTIREIRVQTGDFVKKLGKLPAKDTIANTSKTLNQKLSSIEEELLQVKSKASEDPLNFPIKLNDKLAGVAGVVESADAAPTKQSYALYDELAGKIDDQLAKYRQIVDTDLPAFNALVKNENVPAVILKPVEKNK
ncbi:MAG TPA: glycosyl hydrolase, partial [Bacteroidota bacterium]